MLALPHLQQRLIIIATHNHEIFVRGRLKEVPPAQAAPPFHRPTLSTPVPTWFEAQTSGTPQLEASEWEQLIR